MCKNAAANAANVMKAIEPTLVNLLTTTGLATTDDGKAAIAAYNAAELAVASWTPGTTATEVEELVADANTVFQGLPVPADFKTFAAIIAGGFAAVLGILGANTKAPAEAVEGATPEEVEQAHVIHASAVANKALAHAEELTGFQPSLIDKTRVVLGDSHITAKRYTELWAKTVAASGPQYAALAV